MTDEGDPNEAAKYDPVGWPVAELEEMIPAMQQCQNFVYASALSIGNHDFQQFAGLMSAYIKICEEALERKIDFITGLGAAEIHAGKARYIGEKVGRIFGRLFKSPKLVEAFCEQAFGLRVRVLPNADREMLILTGGALLGFATRPECAAFAEELRRFSSALLDVAGFKPAAAQAAFAEASHEQRFQAWMLEAVELASSETLRPSQALICKAVALTLCDPCRQKAETSTLLEQAAKIDAADRAGNTRPYTCAKCGKVEQSGPFPPPPALGVGPLPKGWVLVTTELDRDDELHCGFDNQDTGKREHWTTFEMALDHGRVQINLIAYPSELVLEVQGLALYAEQMAQIRQFAEMVPLDQCPDEPKGKG